MPDRSGLDTRGLPGAARPSSVEPAAQAMNYFDKTLPTVAENLALDEALLLDAEAGGPEVLRLWSWPTHAVVLGAGGRLAGDVDEAACKTDGVPILRRS